RRSRAGGKFQSGRAGGCEWRQQRQGFCRRREALALRGRRCDARFDVSPRAGRHWRQFVSLARLEEPALSRSHGKRASNGQEFESRQSGYGRKPAFGAGIRAGAKRNVHFYQQDAQEEASAVRLYRVSRRKRNYAGRGRSQFEWQESGRSGARRRDFWREGESTPAARSDALVSARDSLGHPQDQGQERSERRWAQAVAAKGHGPGASRFDSIAFVASWRNGSWPEAARLQLRVAEENAPRRVALGIVGKASGTKVDGRGCARSRNAQDQRFARDAREAERQQVRFARIAWRKPQSGTRQPESGRRESCGSARSACVRRVEARLGRSLEGFRRAAEPFA